MSLMKLFGFSDGEVRKLYLDGNLITVTVSAVLCVPLAKWGMNALFPRLIANVAMRPDMRMPVWLYATLFALIFGCHFLVSLLLSRRQKKWAPRKF